MMKWELYLNDGRLRISERNKEGESKNEYERDNRNEYESDLGRVIFSPAVRRMHDKTQVMPLSYDDNIHTRLTHSFEVMAVANSIGIRLNGNNEFLDKTKISSTDMLRKLPVIIQTAAIVHDVGNPPFGHLGEESIKDYFKNLFEKNNFGLSKKEKEDFTRFDGNAQGFRILTKLQILDDIYGLNLTKATLGAYLKYPNADKIDDNKIGSKKRGVFQSERAYLEEIANDTGMSKGKDICRHPLSYLVEAADNICYRAMDIEDGFNKKYFTFEELAIQLKKTEIYDKIIEINKTKESNAAKISAFRLLVINRMVTLTIKNYVSNLETICNGEYNKELVEDGSNLDDDLKRVCQKWIYKKREVVSMELKGDNIIKGLLAKFTDLLLNKPEIYLNRALPLISASILKAALMENKKEDFSKLSNYYKLRVIVDFISGMTDQFALTQYGIFYG